MTKRFSKDNRNSKLKNQIMTKKSSKDQRNSKLINQIMTKKSSKDQRNSNQIKIKRLSPVRQDFKARLKLNLLRSLETLVSRSITTDQNGENLNSRSEYFIFFYKKSFKSKRFYCQIQVNIVHFVYVSFIDCYLSFKSMNFYINVNFIAQTRKSCFSYHWFPCDY